MPPATRDSDQPRPRGQEFLMRGFAVPVLIRLYREQPMSENQLRTTIPYSSLLTALGDLEEAGWVEKVQTRVGGRDGQGRISRVLKWRLTDKGTKVAASLDTVATLMDVLDPEQSE